MDSKFKKGEPLPESIGLCADLYNEVKTLRLAMEKEVKPIKDREAEIKAHIIDNLSKSDDTGAAGLKYRAQITSKSVPTAEDWDKIREFIREHNRFDLMGKSLNAKAVAEMWDEGEQIPGVGKFNKVDVSITKL